MAIHFLVLGIVLYYSEYPSFKYGGCPLWPCVFLTRIIFYLGLSSHPFDTTQTSFWYNIDIEKAQTFHALVQIA